MPLRVMVIVEGKAEDGGAIRTLLERIWYELLETSDYIEIETWQHPQGKLLQADGANLQRVVDAAAIALHATQGIEFRRLLLIMIDTEGRPENCPKILHARLLESARAARSDTDIACVLPHVNFETWFAAAALSLRGKNDLPMDLPKINDPEEAGLGKGWIKKHLPRKYKETVDQPRFAGQLDLRECSDASRSFRKLVKELRLRLPSESSAPLPAE